MELQFQVKNQRLYLNTVNQVVADSKNYLTATFTFTDDWDGATKVAQFTRGTTTTNVTISNGNCTVPQAVLAGEGEFFVSVYGSINNEATIITANAVKIAVLPSGFVANAGTISQEDAAALQAHADAVTAVVNSSTASLGGYAKEVVFTVRGQSMYLTSRGKVVADSQGYLGARFLFSEDWDDVIKVAQFKRNDLFFSIILNSDGTCTIPWEVLVDEGTFIVSVFGNNRPNEENRIITVNPVEVHVEKSGLTDGELPSNPTYGIDGSTLYEIMVYADRAEAAASTATTAKNQAQGYASDASDSADSASASASAASQSATSASNSATSAANSATAAANAQLVVENYASGFAPLTSPAFDGIPTAPTAMVGTDTDQIATTAFVQAELEDYATLLDLDDYVELTSSGYIKSASVSGDTLTLTRGDDTTVTYTPDIPTKVSDLTNDVGYITGVDWDDVEDKPTFATVATSGSYNDLSNKPTIPTVPTNISAFTNDSGYATTAYVDTAAASAVSDLVDSAPATLDTLEELANALGDDPNFATTIATQIGAKADASDLDDYLPLTGGTLTGDLYMQSPTNKSVGFMLTNTDPDNTNYRKNLDIGWDYENRDGAGFYLRSVDWNGSESGAFGAYARNATDSCDLRGYPDGRLTWGGTAISLDGHTHSYLPLSGGTMTGLIISNTNPSIDATSATRVEESVTRGVDKNGLTLGQNFYSAYSADVFNALRATNPNYNSGTNWTDLRLHVDKNGKSWISFERHSSVTDGTADNNTHIPTTAWLHNNYLPLSGGTMTGAITTSAVDFIKRNVNNNHLTIMGGTAYGNSASIYLTGGDTSSNGGSFQLRAQAGSGNKDLVGKPDGTLTWDSNSIALSKDFLPLAGGTMSGWLQFSSQSGRIQMNRSSSNNDGDLGIYGGSGYSTGAYLWLNGAGKASQAGYFGLRAVTDGSTYKELQGRPDGTLTWGGKNVERVNAIGTNYIRYESGLQICHGAIGDMSSSGITVTFPQPFNANPVPVFSTSAASNFGFITALSSTGMTVKTSNNGGYVRYIAIGRWK